jgi:hypothetical protein
MDSWLIRYEQAMQITDERIREAEGARLAARTPRHVSDPVIVRMQRLLIEALLLPFTLSEFVAPDNRRIRVKGDMRSIES